MTTPTTKPVLKSKTTTHIEVDYNDLDTFISKVYGQAFEIVASEEWGNDSQHRFTIGKKTEMHEYDRKKIDAFKAGNGYEYLGGRLLQDMVNNDILPPGVYLINVSW